MSGKSPSSSPFEPANLLLVDDNAGNLVALEAVLDTPEFNLFKAQSGMEAIKLVEKHDFALILLDIQMPIMDGFETAKQIKATEKGKDVPVIFITAVYNEDPFVKRGYEAGGIDYFGKPFDPDILRTKVSVYANLFQKTRLIKKQELRLDLTEKFLRSDKSLLENLPVGVMIADGEGTVYQGNEESLKIWGEIKQVRLEEYDQYQGWFRETGEKLQSADWPMARAFSTGRTYHNMLINIESFDGTHKTILNSASPLHGEKAEIVGVLGVLQDITNNQFIDESMMKRYHAVTA